MKLSDYVAGFLAEAGVSHVFVLAGGASLHLIDSIGRRDDIEHICPLHEQAAAMAADAYSRHTGRIGAAIATSGPGATNLITGICSAYFDSVPVFFITGQVSTFRCKSDTGVRQIGFQETDVVPMVSTVTNYAVQVTDPKHIRYALEKALYLAGTGRPGPVLVDIPDNLQREDVCPTELQGFTPERGADLRTGVPVDGINKILRMIDESKRPVLILGWGIHLSGAELEARDLAERLQIPVAPTWAAVDVMPSSHPLYIGTFGTHGTRYANFAVQNADLILAVGSRLDTKATGSPPSTFARGARKIVVDIDSAELDKFSRFGLDIDVPIQADAKVFLRELLAGTGNMVSRSRADWRTRIQEWQAMYPICPPEYAREASLNPYFFVKQLSLASREDAIIVCDTGCTLAWMMQGFEFKDGQRFYHDLNNTAMGWALPAAIGASVASGRQVICVVGDGSLQMNIQELATVIHYGLPIKVFVINNQGYSMIRQTQDQWLDSRYLASSPEGGVPAPDILSVASAYGFKTLSLAENSRCSSTIGEALSWDGPLVCDVEISHLHRVTPQVKFGRPNEDSEPLLPDDEFRRCMIVDHMR